jgi:hypothetical protein
MGGVMLTDCCGEFGDLDLEPDWVDLIVCDCLLFFARSCLVLPLTSYRSQPSRAHSWLLARQTARTARSRGGTGLDRHMNAFGEVNY